MKIKSIKKLKGIKGKTVLLRTDYNVPIVGKKIGETSRVEASFPTLRYLLRYKAKIVIMTHLGRPEGFENKYSTKPIAAFLEKISGVRVKHASDCIGFKVEEEILKMRPGEILLLENLRFYKEEESDNIQFAKRLSRLGDIYVNDAFAVSHRANASVSAIKKFMPSYAGLLLENEVMNLRKIISPSKPLVVIVGGAKISTKLPLLMKLGKKADNILIGGGVANNFLFALGYEIGKSLADKKDYELAGQAAEYYKKTGDLKNILPVDFVVSKNIKGTGKVRIKTIGQIEKDDYIYDLGPKTIKIFSRIIKKAETIVWNGPLGMFENPKFKHATLALARLVASRSSGKCFSLIGGGETVEAVKKAGVAEYIDWVSTGGGAMLAYLSGEEMPGLRGLIN